MHPLYPYTPANPNRFADYLASNGCHLDDEQRAFARKLAALPPAWWWQTARMLDGKDVGEAEAKFASVIDLIEQLAYLGLGMNPNWPTLCATFKKVSQVHPGRFKDRSTFCRHAYQLIERVGQHLLIQRLEGGGVTEHVRQLIAQHRKNAPETIHFGRRLNGYKTAAKLREERAAERLARLSGINDFYMRDLGYVSVPFTITAPPRFNPGYGCNVNQEWLDAGCPTPLDAHQWMLEKLEAIDDAARKIGIKLRGYRTVETFRNGVAHHAGQCYVHPDQADKLLSIMRRILPDQTNRAEGEFTKTNQQLVARIETDPDRAAQWLSYIDKHGHGRKPREEDNGGKDENHDTFYDEDAAFLYGWKQHSFFGQKPIQNWRMFKKLDRRQLSDEGFRESLPESILRAWKAATGFMIINGRPVYAGHDYRSYLRLTEPEYQQPQKNSQRAIWTPGPPLQFKRSPLPNGDTYVALITTDNCNVSVVLPRKVDEQINMPDSKIFESIHEHAYSFPQLRISLPTSPGEPSADPPEKPPIRRFCFKRR